MQYVAICSLMQLYKQSTKLNNFPIIQMESKINFVHFISVSNYCCINKQTYNGTLKGTFFMGELHKLIQFKKNLIRV